jgi:hypothetical protein
MFYLAFLRGSVMKRKFHRYLFSMCGGVLALAAGLLPLPAARAQTIRETAKVGIYSITLKVTVPPTNSFFDGPNGMTVCEGVAVPNRVSRCIDCLLVAFIKENGNPVGHARVNISYRKLSPKAGPWRELPVVRIWIGTEWQPAYAETRQTTHFGNHVQLFSGHYEARVTVNGFGPATFRFSLHPLIVREKMR